MELQGVDALVLCGENNICYTTGVVAPSREAARAGALRSVALVTADEAVVFQPSPLDFDAGAQEVARALSDVPGAVAIDEYPSLAVRDALRARSPGDAMSVLSAAKIVKTPEEVERIRAAQRVNEDAIDVVRPLAVPGARQRELTAAFFGEIFRRGATGNTVDPVWDIVPASIADLACTLTGHLPFPTPSADHVLAAGDVMFNDMGIDLAGWASDFGRTWPVGAEPSSRQQDQFERWCMICAACEAAIKPGATAADVARAATAANDGVAPWFPHLYVAHGIGTESAELPFCGTDLGPEIEDQVVLAPGMILVLEPVAWDDGHGGYRAEEIVVVTDHGCERLTHYTYAPYRESR
jgi:Xaa-Pro aminopeptidase